MTDEAFPWITDASADDDALPHAAFETRFPRPWTVEHGFESFAVLDVNYRPLGHFHFHNRSSRFYPLKCLSREEAFQLAIGFANLGVPPRWAANPNASLKRNFLLHFAGSKATNSNVLSGRITSIFGIQRFATVAGLLGLILGVIFGLFSFAYVDDYMARTGVLAICAVWGTLTGAAIGHSVPRSRSPSPQRSWRSSK